MMSLLLVALEDRASRGRTLRRALEDGHAAEDVGAPVFAEDEHLRGAVRLAP